jgi:hypothetical protein
LEHAEIKQRGLVFGYGSAMMGNIKPKAAVMRQSQDTEFDV